MKPSIRIFIFAAATSFLPAIMTSLTAAENTFEIHARDLAGGPIPKGEVLTLQAFKLEVVSVGGQFVAGSAFDLGRNNLLPNTISAEAPGNADVIFNFTIDPDSAALLGSDRNRTFAVKLTRNGAIRRCFRF